MKHTCAEIFMRNEHNAVAAQQDLPIIDVYLACTADWRERLEECSQLLSTKEASRARHYLVSGAREEFILGRTMLRCVVGQRLGVAPKRVDVRVGANGKPCTSGAEFSLTHSHGLVVLAVSSATPLGIDVERLDDTVEVGALASEVFSADVCEAILGGVDAAAKLCRFFNRWTRFEAIHKISGDGIAIHTSSLHRSSGTHNTCTEAPNVICRALPAMVPGFVGAVAAGCDFVLRLHDFADGYDTDAW